MHSAASSAVAKWPRIRPSSPTCCRPRAASAPPPPPAASRQRAVQWQTSERWLQMQVAGFRLPDCGMARSRGV
eukprot:scaffold84140_cov54-Phaeocystis_antarctica.AAC.2